MRGGGNRRSMAETRRRRYLGGWANDQGPIIVNSKEGLLSRRSDDGKGSCTGEIGSTGYPSVTVAFWIKGSAELRA